MMLAAFPARLAYGMVGLDIYFKVHDDTHSIALAGLAAGVNGVVGSLTTGLRAAAIDRMGLKIPLRVFVPGCHCTRLALRLSRRHTFSCLCRNPRIHRSPDKPRGSSYVAYRSSRRSISNRHRN